MFDPTVSITAVRHQMESILAKPFNTAPGDPDQPDTARDRGAVSLEHVLWFVAAGVSVAVVAGVLWTQIRSHAATPISTPSAP